MPIKSTNTAVTIPKKVIYVNWCEQEVLTEEEFNDSVQERIAEMKDDAYCFGDFVTDNYDYRDIGRALMNADFREEVIKHYEAWCYDHVIEEMDCIERFEV